MIIINEKHPIKIWATSIEEGALKQAKNLAKLPFLVGHVAIMPDVHEGFGMPIGGIIALDNVIIPNAVGVDIGCGMCAIKTNIKAAAFDTKKLKKLLDNIRKRIPTGFAHHSKAVENEQMPGGFNVENLTVVRSEYSSARHQLGTLGGGNHFIEIQKDQDDFVWIMLHSGSRNLGKKVADYYHKLALKTNEREMQKLAIPRDLAFLRLNSEEGKAYFEEMSYCIEFAFCNRKKMMEVIQEEFSELLKGKTKFGSLINIAHNYARIEKHHGKKVVVHRKGATSAKKGEVGIIPGSMGSMSYIVEGLGNSESYCSCSHGAGRKLGRKQAQQRLDLEKEINYLNSKGIVHGLRSVKNLDEAPGAYKDISEVMRLQSDLVRITTELSPLAVIKD